MFELDQFINPEPAYGIHPFWFWNGEMSDSQIQHQITEMADKGITGFFICARQGMSIPYLSEEWFRKVSYAIEIAADHNMNVWLYDEYPYPSGMAGGEVTLEHADAKHVTLIHHVEKVEDGQTINFEMAWGRVLSAKAVPVNQETGELQWKESIDVKKFIGNIQVEPVFQKTGLTAYTQKRYFTYEPKKSLNWTAPEGNWEIHCFLEEEIKDFKYYGTFVDPCHTEAISTFIHTTHERYAETIGHHFGKTVKGIFSDEVHLLGRYPWSPRLVAFIKETYGYDIREYLHLLVDNRGEHVAKIRYHYFQAIHLLLRQAYHKQVHDWCEQKNLEYVAEVPSARMSTQFYSHIPGGDSAHEKLGRSLDWILKRYFYGFRKNPKMISSLSNQLGRERALIESFHSIGWSMTLQDAKWMIDRLAAFGINFFNFHAFFYTIDAMVKHDAPPSQFLQNPYWKHYRLLGDYTARMSYIMSKGSPVRHIAVLDPTTSLWTHMGNPFKNSFPYAGKDDNEKMKLEQLKKHWSDICISLTTGYKDYDHLDPELLSRATISNGIMKIGKTRYTVLILPPLTNIESKAWEKIKHFINNGGTVIANGLLPHENIEDDESIFEDIKNVFGLVNYFPSDFWDEKGPKNLLSHYSKGNNNAYFIPSKSKQPVEEKNEALFKILSDHLEENITFKVNEDSKSFLMQHRKFDDQSEVVFVSNQEGKEHKASLYIKESNKNTTFNWLDLETGNTEEIYVKKEGHINEIELYFAPYQSYLIQMNKQNESMNKENKTFKSRPEYIEIAASGPWEINHTIKNMMRFNELGLSIGSEEKTSDNRQKIDGQVQVKTIIDQCEDLAQKQMMPVQFSQTFGTPMKVNMSYPMNVRYKTYFFVDKIPSYCSLVMDKSAISGDLEILINDTIVPYKAFQQKFVYDHNNLVCDIESLINSGKNTIQVRGQVNHDWEGLIDSLYIMGDFGVSFDENLCPIVTCPPNMVNSITGPYKGLPYYAGTITLRRNININTLPDTQTFVVHFKEFEEFHECAEVIINGHSLGVRAWSPYEWYGKTKNLLKGSNIVEVKVTNTLNGLLEGDAFNYQTHELNDVRITKK